MNNEVLDIIQSHNEEIAKIERWHGWKQRDVVDNHKNEWNEINKIIKSGRWIKEAVFKAKAYGLKVSENLYVFQLDAPLPSVPNPYYWRFEEHHDKFLAAKLLVSLQLRNVIEQLGVTLISESAALKVKHYYNREVRLFDLDNKAKQLVINTLLGTLIEDNSSMSLAYFSEEAIKDVQNRTMIYIGTDSQREFLEKEIADKYSRIDNLPGAIEGKDEESFQLISIKDIEFNSIRQLDDRFDHSYIALCNMQRKLIETHRKHWSKLNYFVKTDQIANSPEYTGNVYGIKLDDDNYVFQLDMLLPFIANPYTKFFKENAKNYYTVNWFITELLNSVLEQLDIIRIFPASIHVKHFYSNAKVFECDSKIKQILINIIRRAALLMDDDLVSMPLYSEEGIKNETESYSMIYLTRLKKSNQASHIEKINKYMELKCIKELKGTVRGINSPRNTSSRLVPKKPYRNKRH